jgi:hypothetical protein
MKNRILIFVLFSLILTIQTATAAEEWKTLGIGEIESCASYDKECVANIKTRYGELSLKTNDDGDFKLSIDKKEIATYNGYSISIQEKFQIGTNDIFLVALNSGGMACPMDLYVVQIGNASNYKVSERFGTCSDAYKASVTKDSLIVKMPSYFNPMHTDDLSDEEKKEIDQAKGSVYTWFDSRITEKTDTE